MEQVAVIVVGILGATGLLIGISFGAIYLVPTLNNIPTSWSLVMAMGTVMITASIILALWFRNENVKSTSDKSGVKTIKANRKGPHLKNFKIAVALASGCLFATLAITEKHAKAQEEGEISKIASTCESCHGQGGNSVTAAVPRLNGQQAAYLIARFNSFRDPSTQSTHATNNMWPVTTQVADQTIPALAKYFASQPPAQPQGSGPLFSEGEKLFKSGAPGIPACQTCHGEHAEGKGAIPRLAGQHAEYLKTQLSLVNLNLRDSNAMHPNVKNMTDDQMNAVADYLAND